MLDKHSSSSLPKSLMSITCFYVVLESKVYTNIESKEYTNLVNVDSQLW